MSDLYTELSLRIQALAATIDLGCIDILTTLQDQLDYAGSVAMTHCELSDYIKGDCNVLDNTQGLSDSSIYDEIKNIQDTIINTFSL